MLLDVCHVNDRVRQCILKYPWCVMSCSSQVLQVSSVSCVDICRFVIVFDYQFVLEGN